MEKLIQRQNITFEYLPNEGFSTDSPHKNSSDEMDFNDVFGGPPRRFSMQEMRVRCSFGPETIESDEERTTSLLSPWNSEKPVFGEESNSGLRRRQHNPSDDFYGDIFRGDDSSYSSPRRIDRDKQDNVFGSSPSSSRIMSPSKHEAFSVSLPPQFSLPAKITKATEFPTFGPRNHTSSSLSRFSNQANRSSPLSHQSSISSTEDSPPSTDHQHVGPEKETRDVPDDSNSGNQFHFSIYKWAGRDVPVLIPFLSGKSQKDKSKNDSFAESRLSSEANRDDVQSFEVDVEKNDSTGAEKINETEVTVEESPIEVMEKKKVEVESLGETDIKLNDCIVKEEASASLKSRVKSLRVFLTDDDEKPGKVAEVKENKVERASKGVKKKSSDVRKTKKDETDPKSDGKGEATVLQGDKKSGVKGKIRDFVQIFNHEADSSLKSDNGSTRSRSYRWKTVSIQQNEDESNADLPKQEEKLSSDNQEKKQNVALKVEDKDEPKQYADTKIPTNETSHSSTNQKNEFPSDQRNRVSRASMENLDDPLEYNFVVQEISDEHQKNTQSEESSEDIKALDAKIHQWSVGKKGNIRSLLSTLQYVLWQGSGWQPIALVDLIESNSVRRAYQKALLRLHPDKLQQKGAASDHKYIAEKVFDILQEAWDHFNTLGL